MCIFHNGCISDTKIEFHVLAAEDKGSIVNVCWMHVIYAQNNEFCGYIWVMVLWPGFPVIPDFHSEFWIMNKGWPEMMCYVDYKLHVHGKKTGI